MEKSGQGGISWKQVTNNFFQRELLTILLWSSLGAIAAALVRAVISDNSFDKFLITTYLPPPDRFDEPARYFPYLLTGAVALTIIALIRLWRVVRRGMVSWCLGVTSGLKFLSFTSTAVVMSLTQYSMRTRLFAGCVALLLAFIAAGMFRYSALARAARLPTEESVRVSIKDVETEDKTQATDEPIASWREDTLGRAPIVEAITTKILVSKSPVIALFGGFGSGKTSILNLLREHLDGKAIVVSFSTWLPGSEATLTSYLLADIATECQKTYMVPGLRQSATRLAGALAQSIPLLRGITALIPATTQRDDIENLKAALRRLPKQVVVLLDELDRMESSELRTLLKVVRGVSALPNLTFVCAAERNTLVETVRGMLNDSSNLYFEKFFPVAVPIPVIGEAELLHTGTERLVVAFENRGWFESETGASNSE